LHTDAPTGIMARGKRGAEQDVSKTKRGRLAQHVEHSDPVAEQCHTVAEALQSATVPPVIKEMLVDVIPNALAVRRDERHRYQEQMVETIGNTLHSVEADIQSKLSEAEKRWQQAETTAEELKREQALAEQAAKATSDLSLEKKTALAQTALKFREAKHGLTEARQAEQAGIQEVNKFAKDIEILALAMNRFEPLKNGTLEPTHAIQEAEHLMNLIEGRLELDATLCAALSNALITPILERSSFTMMVVHQFEDSLRAQIEDLQKQYKTKESSKAALATAVLTAEQVLEIAVGQQIEAATAFTKENDAHDAKTKLVNDKKKALRDTKPLIRKCASSLAELQVELDNFHQGPLEAFEKLQCRTKETLENTATAAPEGEEAELAQDAEIEASKPATSA